MSGFHFGQNGQGRRDVVSYVALGDSFTEGLSDPYPNGDATARGRFRGWADRVAEDLVAHADELRYANLAVRGLLAKQIITEQVPRAVELRPDLVTLCAGGNDIIRPGSDPDLLAKIFRKGIADLSATGAHVVIFTSFDPYFQPVMRHLRGKAATYNMHLRGIAEDYGCSVVDLWNMQILQDRRAWSRDRLHMSPEGHRRIALRVCDVLGIPTEDDWRAPMPPAEPVHWRTARQEDMSWAREFLVPWIGRRITGRSSGDGCGPKRPKLEPVR